MFSASVLSLLLWPAASVASYACKAPDPSGNDTPVKACKLAAQNDVHFSVGFDYNGDCAPSTGELRAFMIFVDFSDAEAPANDPPKELRDVFLPKAAEWYATASNGALSLNVTADVSRYYRMPASAASYHWETGLSFDEHQVYIQDALEAYTLNGRRPAPPETDVLYIVPTPSAGSYITRSIAFDGRANTRKDVYVARKTITFGTDAFLTWGFKALNHETGHAMCLPDYYPFASGLETQYYVGGWSVMGDIAGPGPDYFAWDQWRLGWLSDEDFDCVVEHGTSQHILTPLEVKGGTKAVVIATNETSAVVAEARVAKGLDSNVCAPGVLLYTIDTTVASGNGPIRVLDANPSTGGCGGANGELNDATLSLDSGNSSYDVPGWGIKVKLVSQDGGMYKIQVDYS
ncbi:Fc.00g095530.m01.CDS01 [Cosmosporella sp. VM-42]